MNHSKPIEPKRAVFFLSGLVFVLLGLFVFYLFYPVADGFYPICPFHRLTGLYCPGCGSTRATYWLLHGDVVKALQYNALYVIVLPFIAFFGLNAFMKSFVGKEIVKLPSVSRPVFWTIVALILFFGVLRNIPYQPFLFLAPP